MTNLNFYIQYHNTDKLGYFPGDEINFNKSIKNILLNDNEENDFWIYTSKKKLVEKSKGSKCFLIVGKTENKIKNYYLWSYFKIQNYQEKDKKIIDVYGKGRYMKNPIYLNNLPDFDNFKKFCGNFGIGFQNITNHNFSQILNSYASDSPIHKPFETNSYNSNEYDKFYKEYGKFIIHFENINFQLCYYIRKICTSNSMFSEEDRRIDILLEGLTANPLLFKFKSIFLTTELSKNLELRNLVDRFVKNFTKVIEIRNFVAHGTFFLGDPHGNVENFEVRKPKLGSKGYQQNVNIISIQSLQKLNKDIQKLENFISNLKIYVANIEKEHTLGIYNEMKSLLENLDISLNILNKSIEH